MPRDLLKILIEHGFIFAASGFASCFDEAFGLIHSGIGGIVLSSAIHH